ncbi:MAG: hypothetical protein ACAH11_13070 [Sphingomonas sp.]
MDMPPSRYKVVEKGRRLVVVDRLTGEAVRHQLPGPPPARGPEFPASRMELPRRESRAPAPASRPRAAGSGMRFTTDGLYDTKAPREIQLTDNAQIGLVVGAVVLGIVALVLFGTFGFPVLIIAAVLLANVRKGLRASITLWLDSYEQA